MRCKPWRWLWGLVPLALLGWLGVVSEQERIEKDLQTRVEAAFATASLTWASASSFEGRDGTVTGKAADDSDRRQAAAIAKSVWGVRNIEDKVALLDEEKNYTWTAAMRENRLKLAGFAPNEGLRRAIIGRARATFPGRDIDDRMSLARGAPDQDVWLGGVNFALEQLARLKGGGRVDIEGTTLLLDGEAIDGAAYRNLKAALATDLPTGIKLKQDKVIPPAVKPFVWSAIFDSSQIVLSGHAPNERSRDEILAALRRALPKLAINDRTELGSGEPKGWLAAVTALAPKLAQLDRGTVEIKDAQGTLTGETEDEKGAEELRKAIRSDFVTPIRVVDRITYKPSAELEAKRKAEENARVAAAAEAARKAEEATRQAAADAQRKAEEADARRRDDEAARQAALESTRKAEESSRLAALEAQRALDQARRQAEQDALRRQQTGALQTPKPSSGDERCQTLLRSGGSQGMINFKRASADIEATVTTALDQLAEVARACANARIEITGHTDAEGTEERNKTLSERRAQAAAAYLAKAGVAEGRITIAGFGEDKPLAPSDSEANRSKNRRIEFAIRLN